MLTLSLYWCIIDNVTEDYSSKILSINLQEECIMKKLMRFVVFTLLLVIVFLVINNKDEIVKVITNIPISWICCYLAGSIITFLACNGIHLPSLKKKDKSVYFEDEK